MAERAEIALRIEAEDERSIRGGVGGDRRMEAVWSEGIQAGEGRDQPFGDMADWLSEGGKIADDEDPVRIGGDEGLLSGRIVQREPPGGVRLYQDDVGEGTDAFIDPGRQGKDLRRKEGSPGSGGCFGQACDTDSTAVQERENVERGSAQTAVGVQIKRKTTPRSGEHPGRVEMGSGGDQDFFLPGMQVFGDGEDDIDGDAASRKCECHGETSASSAPCRAA